MGACAVLLPCRGPALPCTPPAVHGLHGLLPVHPAPPPTPLLPPTRSAPRLWPAFLAFLSAPRGGQDEDQARGELRQQLQVHRRLGGGAGA